MAGISNMSIVGLLSGSAAITDQFETFRKFSFLIEIISKAMIDTWPADICRAWNGFAPCARWRVSGGFSAAADALGLTQPAVSNQIRQLEQQLGTSLLERIGKGSRPTPRVTSLIAACARAFAELDRAWTRSPAPTSAVSGPLVLATGATATTHLLPPVMVDLRVRHPGIDLRVMTGNTVDMIPGLLDGSIDLGLLTASVRDRHLRSRFFFRDRLVCVAAGRDADLKTIRPRDLKTGSSFLYDRGGSIRRAVDTWLDAADRRRIRVASIGSAEAQTAFARAGLRLVDRLGGRRARGRRGRTHRPLPA